jgi:hypothetical protein
MQVLLDLTGHNHKLSLGFLVRSWRSRCLNICHLSFGKVCSIFGVDSRLCSDLVSRRQDLMIKYEAIREQMKEAQTEREKETMVALAAEAEKETFMTGEEKPKDVPGAGRTPGRGLLLGRRKELPEITQRIARVRDSNIAGANSVVEEGLRSLGLSSRVLAPEMAAGDPEKTE